MYLRGTRIHLPVNPMKRAKPTITSLSHRTTIRFAIKIVKRLRAINHVNNHKTMTVKSAMRLKRKTSGAEVNSIT